MEGQKPDFQPGDWCSFPLLNKKSKLISMQRCLTCVLTDVCSYCNPNHDFFLDLTKHIWCQNLTNLQIFSTFHNFNNVLFQNGDVSQR